MNVLPPRRSPAALLVATLVVVVLGVSVQAQTSTSVHLSYHWHLHQPIYWPENLAGTNRYQFAGDSITLKQNNSGNFYPGSTYKHPRNALVSGDGGEYDSVFDKDDRKGAYQSGPRNSLATLGGHADAGVSVSYSGALMENIWSLGKDNRYGYGPGWNGGNTEARGWRTRGNFPKMDMVGMTYHHAFSPLLPKSVLRKEIQIFKEIWWKSWGGNPDKSDHSKGFWPVEVAFSETMIPILTSEGYQWSIVANSHLARTCPNYMSVASRGTGGWNIDPPNKADQLGPTVPANQWYSGSRDARGGTFPAPFAYQAHKVKYVDPSTGAETKLTIVPMCDFLSYENGYGSMGTGVIDAKIAPFNNPAQPSIVLMAHDGDNAWGGGSSYYFESVPGLMNEAASKGYRPTSIQQFLADHPVPDSDVVHIEDGAWVNAADDWGHPQFINWLWPPTRSPSDPARNSLDPRTWYDLESPGWTEDWRNWAVLVAGANYCETAEQIAGGVQAWRIQEPMQKNGTNNNPTAAEQAWHYYLGGLDSGFMYYGTSLDDEVKQTLACNRAITFAQQVIGTAAADQTPPTVFKPQRFPWNPGGMGWGSLTGYKEVGFNGKPPWPSDFYVWTHAFDVSGVASVKLFVRADLDGVNPLSDNDNETYAGGPGVGAWTQMEMNKRAVPTGNVTNNSQLSFFLTPTAIADYYWAKVAGYRNQLVDYYIEAVDAKGNVTKSDIQHVWVADDGASLVPPATPSNVAASATSSTQVTVSWSASSGAASYRVRRGGVDAGTTVATTFSDSGLTPSTSYSYTVAAINSAGTSADSAPVTATTQAPQAPPVDFVMNGRADSAGYLMSNPGMNIYAAVRGTKLYVATWTPAGGSNDHFIFVSDALLASATAAAPWSKVGNVAVAASKPYLAGESAGTFVGWSNAPAGSSAVRSSTAGEHMEGVIDLVAAFGQMPATIYVASAAYATANGGALTAQAPAGNANGNLEPAEFLALPVATLRDSLANGTLDYLDPARDFKPRVLARETGGGFTVSWNTVPGRTYRLEWCASLASGWQTVTGGTLTAASGQQTASVTDGAAVGAATRFYRILLLP